MHLNNKSSLRKKQQEHVTLACILFFPLRAVSKTSAFGVLWLSSQPCCLRPKAHGDAETRPAIGQDHLPGTAPLLCLTPLRAPSLPRSHCQEGEDFSLLLPPCCFPRGLYHPLVYRDLSRPISTNSPSSQCLHSSAALSLSVTLGWRCSHYLRQPGKYILLH